MKIVKVTRAGGLVIRSFYNDDGITMCCLGSIKRTFHPGGGMKIACSQCGRELALTEYHMLQVEIKREK